MRITIIAVGSIKEKFYRDAIAEYEKRLSRYCKLNIVQVEDEKTPDKMSQAQGDAIKKKEAERILKHVKEDACVIALAIRAKMYDSEAFAEEIERLGIQGSSHIQFLIGGSLGLHQDVLDRADQTMSFSTLTFPHQLMRVILLEQIYRGFRIINGEPYHK